MKTPLTDRPAWRFMGLWKWLALALLLFYFAAVVPYMRSIGGTNGLDDSAMAGMLSTCAFELDATPKGGALDIRARIDPQCARTLGAPVVRIRSADGDIVAEAPLSGNPNALEAELTLPALSAPAGLQLEIAATDRNGAAVSTALPIP